MEHEHQPDQAELTGIHINFENQAIEFEDQHGTIGGLRFTGETVLYEGQPLLLRPTPDAGAAPEPAPIPPARPTRPPRSSRNPSL
jgi:hypothetical protein